jgi:Short C-terminal domain
VIVLEWLGALIYLIINHRGMSERRTAHAHAADDHVRTAAGTGGAASEIEKAKQLLDSGVIDQAEFDSIKAKALS